MLFQLKQAKKNHQISKGAPMKRLLLAIIFTLMFTTTSYADGVGVVDKSTNRYLTLTNSQVDVNVESQIAIITATQTFRNNFDEEAAVEYAFPLPENASATGLKWKINGQWYQANFGVTPPDSSEGSGGGGGSGSSSVLTAYLGNTPLFFEIEQPLASDSVLIVELTYVELLPYANGKVSFSYPSDYLAIQNTIIDKQELNFNLASLRTISSIQVLSNHNLTTLTNSGSAAYVQCQVFESPADENYQVEFVLDQNDLGLFGYSTQIADSLLPDEHGGFFTFIAEPDPGENVIQKVFTLIVDRSGSMGGTKIMQARDAASFIINNLNSADKFNIVDFSHEVSSFRSAHVPYSLTNQAAALSYINAFYADGGTNISESFNVAVPQFSVANDSTANIIIFFTDGNANHGVTETGPLVNYVDNLIASAETNVLVHTFGIGSNVNTQLLTLLASHNGGRAAFLGNDDLFDVITDFYLKIRNPVLVNTAVSFSPNVVHETYPETLPNLYIGEQLIISGRYTESGPVTVSLSGNAFNQAVEYNYVLNLADSVVDRNQFLTKLWAKSKIEHLLVAYYSHSAGSEEAQVIESQIIEISLDYGVISPFTEFSGGEEVVDVEEDDFVDSEIPVASFELLGNYPNPFNPTTAIRFKVNEAIYGQIQIRIYNLLGQVVRTLTVNVSGAGVYEISWDGLLSDGSVASSGQYIYIIDFDNTILAGKMTLVK